MHQDTLNIVRSYLSYVNKMKFMRVCKKFSELGTDFKKEFINRLKKHMTNPLEFCENLKKYNTYVAGSFVLDVIYGTNYAGDMDIYEGDEKCSNYHNCYFDAGIYKNNLKFMQYIYSLDLATNNLGKKASCNDKEFDGIIRWIFDFKLKSGLKLQHITVRSNKVRTFINNSFDLDICKCCFDGEKLYIKNCNKIFYKYDYIKPMYPLMYLYYNDNGLGHDKCDKKTNDRSEKYIKRGFNIKPHKNHKEILEYILEERSKNEEYSCTSPTFDIIMNGIPFYLSLDE